MKLPSDRHSKTSSVLRWADVVHFEVANLMRPLLNGGTLCGPVRHDHQSTLGEFCFGT